jgi:DsbC/DsbD-like thiol-disulfide interchange protein
MKTFLISLVMLVVGATATQAQILHPVSWSYGAKRLNAKEAVIFLKANIEDGWHIYSQKVGDGGPVKTSFTFTADKSYKLNGPTVEPSPITRFEKTFNMQVSYFEHGVIFQQKIKLTNVGPLTVKGSLEYMTCNDKQCLPPEDVMFSITVK